MKQQKAYLNYLKAIAAIMVLVFHSIIYYEESIGTNVTGGQYFFYLCVSFIHVPLFFFISGFLSHGQDLKKYYTKKLVRLIVPFLLFSLIKLITALVSTPFTWEFFGKQMFDTFIVGKTYWFVYSILLMYVIAPIFWYLLKKKFPYIEVFLIVLIAFNVIREIFNIATTDVLQIDATLYYLPYFLVGILIGNKYKDKLPEINFLMAMMGLLITMVYITLLFHNILPYTKYTKLIPCFASFVFLWYLCKKLPQNLRFFNLSGTYSYQFFLLDAFVVLIAREIYKMSFNHLLMFITINVLLSTLVCYIVSHIPIVSFLFGLNYQKLNLKKK